MRSLPSPSYRPLHRVPNGLHDRGRSGRPHRIILLLHLTELLTLYASSSARLRISRSFSSSLAPEALPLAGNHKWALAAGGPR